MSEPDYIIGIDLGTTNSVVAFVDASVSDTRLPEIRLLDIPQIINEGVVEKQNILPSFIYFPPVHEIPDNGFVLPWDNENNLIVGEYARERGAELPQRLISSSKSWLCNVMIDGNQPVLPWDAPNDISKISPVEASSEILRHIRNAWNDTMASEDDRLKIENQDVFLTVPASFDAVARDLTIKAAESAGIVNVTLLEEPQAAFYSWIESSGDQWRKQVKKGDLVLVCDIGGGTSDFTLIQVSEDDGDLALERIAVGNHLLVGGDNMDLALAYAVSQKMSESGTRIDSWQMRSLVYSCRNAKEKILSTPGMDEYPVTVLGRGSGLISSTIKSSVSRSQIEKILLDGFFPKCESISMPEKSSKIGLQETGLSYESDPAVTRHLAGFLTQQKKEDNDIILPTVVFFNGGVMKSGSVREQITKTIDSWDNRDDPSPVREIHVHDFDYAVAKGAAYYGLARRGRGVRIHGGLGKSYYIGIAASMPAVPGMPLPVKALCVASFGMEEGSRINLTNQEFVLVIGEPVRFDFLASLVRKQDVTGEIIEDWQDEIEEIATIETTLDGEYGKVIRVTIEINVTEVGTLELWCVSVDDAQKWKLEFNVREQV